jgi:zinc protease
MISRLILLCGLVIAPTAVAQAAVGTAAEHIAAMTAGDPPPFTAPTVTERTLSNGMRCFFMQDTFLPLFRFSVLFPAGRIYDPPDSVGLSSLVGTLLRTGGTQEHGAEWIDEYLDQEAIEINFGISWEFGTASLKSLANRRTEAIDLLFEMALAPAFEEERVNIARNKMIESVRRRNDAAPDIGARVFRKLLYGTKSPWAATATTPQLEAMTVQHLKALHATLFAPSQMLCAAAGDFDSDELVAQLETVLGTYPDRTPVTRTPPPVEPPASAGTWFIPKAVPQSILYAGHLGWSRNHPDRFPLIVMNDVLGSSATFTSWLVSAIRTEHGLAYEAWSAMKFGPPRVPGSFFAHSKTRAEGTGQALALVHDNFQKMQAGTAVTAEEVDGMKGAILKRLIFQYEDAFNVVSSMKRFVFFGYPTNYIDIYREKIAAVGLEDVRRVAKQFLRPDQVVSLVVGSEDLVRPQLEKRGPIRVFDLETE